jgi:glycosyltransferase involved in cell wall biosynthesis
VSPKVTVLLPVYGGEEYIGRAVESVLAQTFADFELLAVDDCGPREAVEIVESFADSRIRVHPNERNLGQVGSLNEGLKLARGEYVARLDQDDICLPERLERQIEALDAEPRAALVGSWLHRIDGQGRRLSTLRGRIGDRAELLYLVLTNRFPVAHPTAMFRRSVAIELGGYDPAFRFAEDQDLWRRMILAGHGAQIVEEPLVLYRVHESMQSLRNWDEQQANNGRSLDGFIAASTTRVPAAELRRSLAWESGAPKVDLDALVGGFGLSAAESVRLRRLLRRRLALSGLASRVKPARAGARRIGPLRSLARLVRRVR